MGGLWGSERPRLARLGSLGVLLSTLVFEIADSPAEIPPTFHRDRDLALLLGRLRQQILISEESSILHSFGMDPERGLSCSACG